jgi:DNA-binding NarL/FixJ family response regulator
VFLPLAEDHWGATSSIIAAIALLHQWAGAAGPVAGVGLVGLFPSGHPHAARPAGRAGQTGAQPAMEGIDAAHAIRSAYPRTGVVVLSQYADESYAFELFRDGTAGLAYLLKDRIGDAGLRG